MYYYFLFFFALPYINKPTGTWRSGGADGSLAYVLRGICRNIVGEEQHGMAKVACLRKCRYSPSRVIPIIEGRPPRDWTFKGDLYRRKRSNRDPAVRPNGRRVSRSGTSGRVLGLASRADSAPQETDESQKY